MRTSAPAGRPTSIWTWPTWPLKEYLLPAQPYDFTFTLSPVFDDIR